jgi:hypothetical protein
MLSMIMMSVSSRKLLTKTPGSSTSTPTALFISIESPRTLRDRLVAVVQYEAGVLMIRFFGSHEDYDKINAETI